MKRLLLFISLIIFGLSLGFSQSVKVIDDIYVTPNDAQMVREIQSSKKAKEKIEQRENAVYKNGAREIVFIDKNGNRITSVPDTVYIVENENGDTIAMDSVQQQGYYLNGFRGSKSDYEYAERIRLFHNPKYTINIADPNYNDIYFLDSNYWNVYTDDWYATITPTWNNPYWWNYQFSPYSYGSMFWRSSAWGYPYSWGGYLGGWYNPYYWGYSGWYDPWNYGGWNSYYGWGGYYNWGYPYYGGGYGWNYPYYGGGSWYNATNQTGRRNSEYSSRTVFNSDNSGRRGSSVITSGMSSRNGYTAVSRQPINSSNELRSVRSGNYSSRSTRSSFSPEININTRTGSVRSSNEWNNMRNTRSGYSSTSSSGDYNRSSSSVINRSNPVNTRSSSSYNSEGNYNSSRSYDSGRSSSTRSSYESSSSRSYDSGSSRSSSSYSSGSGRSSSSSSSSYSGGGSSRSSYSSSGGSGRR